jgi:hypothetical protein
MRIVSLIAEVLGMPDGKAEKQAMVDNANEARKEQEDQEAQDLEDMDIES